MRYIKFWSQFWEDEKIKSLTRVQQLVYIYICTGKNNIGMYTLKLEDICGLRSADPNIPPQEAKEILNAIIKSGLVFYDWYQEVVLVRQFLKHNPLTNPNQKLAARKAFLSLPKTSLLKVFVELTIHLYPEVTEGKTDELLFLPNWSQEPIPAVSPKKLLPPTKTSPDISPQDKPLAPPLELSASVLEIFEYWKKTMQHPDAVLDTKRRRSIETALRNWRHTVEDCKIAIDGCRSSAFHMGSNPQKKLYDSISLIFRDSDKFESFKTMGHSERNKVAAYLPPDSTTIMPDAPTDPLKDAPVKFAQVHALIDGIKSFPGMDADDIARRKDQLKKQAEAILEGKK